MDVTQRAKSRLPSRRLMDVVRKLQNRAHFKLRRSAPISPLSSKVVAAVGGDWALTLEGAAFGLRRSKGTDDNRLQKIRNLVKLAP